MIVCVRGILRKGGALQLSPTQNVYLTFVDGVDWRYAWNIDGYWMLSAEKDSAGEITCLVPLRFLPVKRVKQCVVENPE
jgi:hypothetical protein